MYYTYFGMRLQGRASHFKGFNKLRLYDTIKEILELEVTIMAGCLRLRNI